MGTGVKLEENM